LRDELDALRRTLAGLVPGVPGSGPVVVPSPGITPTVGGGSAPVGGGGTGTGATNGTGGGTGSTSGPGGGTGGGGGGILPTGIPSLPLPSVSVSLPPILK
jgi:hypothetical protein